MKSALAIANNGPLTQSVDISQGFQQLYDILGRIKPEDADAHIIDHENAIDVNINKPKSKRGRPKNSKNKKGKKAKSISKLDILNKEKEQLQERINKLQEQANKELDKHYQELDKKIAESPSKLGFESFDDMQQAVIRFSKNGDCRPETGRGKVKTYYSDQKKEEAKNAMILGKLSMNQIANSLNIPYNTLQRWKIQLGLSKPYGPRSNKSKKAQTV